MEAVLPVEIEMGSLRFETSLERTLFHRGVDLRAPHGDGFRWKPFSRADQCGSAKEVLFSSHRHYTSHYHSDLFHLYPHRHYVHIRHHWVHGSWDLLYLLHFIHEGMGFDHRVFELNHPEAMGSDIVFYSFYVDSGAYRDPSSQPALRCLDVVMLPSRDVSLTFVIPDGVVLGGWISASSFRWGTYQICYASHRCYSRPWRRSFSHMSITASITRPRYIVFVSLTIIPELFIDMSSQWSVVRDS
ncbi:hypothetical protein AAG906_024453 [Vitis piasezkii]